MILRKLLTITSIMLLIVLYFWGHNSGTSNEILQSGILHTAIITADIGLVCLLLGIAGGIGRRLLSSVDFEGISIGEQIVIDSTIGLGIISLISVTLGLLGQYNWMIWGIVILLAMAFSGNAKQGIAIYGLIGLAIAHAIEAILYQPLIKQTGETAKHSVLVLVFGYAHYLQLKKITDAS